MDDISENVFTNNKLKYDSKERFISYWHQLNEIFKLKPSNVLEIGIGYGLTSAYLKNSGINVVTLDIKKEFNPNVHGNVLKIPFCNDSFDVVACFEVLEHLPFQEFNNALKEIKRVTNSYVILSLPDFSQVFRVLIHLPRIGVIKKLIPLSFIKAPYHGAISHHWEIGKKGYPLDKIIKIIKEQELKICDTYRLFDHPRHRFFLLKKM